MYHSQILPNEALRYSADFPIYKHLRKVKHIFDSIIRLFSRLYPAIGSLRPACMACIVVAFTIFCASVDASALAPDHFATSSRLASGKWVKVKVEQTGVQFISEANLRKMGFSDPSKVKVYGFGGRQLSFELNDEQPDDLPLVASTSTSRGIYFFGYNHIRWNYNAASRSLKFTHTMHSFAEESWYFLSDSDNADSPLAEAAQLSESPGMAETDSFTELLLHENDLIHPSTTGSRYLGEDFRSPTRRAFDFNLPDIVENSSCYINFAFGSNTTGASELNIEATGKSGAPQTFTDRLGPNTESEKFMVYTTGQKQLQYPGNSLRLELTFQGNGTIRLARLDYIEVQYTRKLRLSEGQLYFQLPLTESTKVNLSGAEASTVVWDVTDWRKPSIVKTSINGSELSFVAQAGLREYIAFTPEKGGYAISDFVNVSNQDIHSIATPDMLIISPSTFMEAADMMANHHRNYDGMTVEILTPEEIYNEFSSGTRDVTAFRRLLKMWHDRRNSFAGDESGDKEDAKNGNLRFCLIMGDATFDNKFKLEGTKKSAHLIVPIWQSPTGESGTTSYSTDDYIGMLADNNGFDIGKEKIHVAVGRMPFESAAESVTLTEKYIKYVTAPETGDWRNRMMFIADDQNGGDHLTQTEDMISKMRSTDAGKRLRYERVYLDSYPLESTSVGRAYPKAKEKMMNIWNSGVSFINYIGHANPYSWTHENLLNWNDIKSFSNRNLPFIYAATCEFARVDLDTRSGAEILWAYPESGIIGIISPSRTVWIEQNGNLTTEVGRAMFKTDADGKRRSIGEIMIDAKNNYPTLTNTNKLRYVLIGNPAMRLFSPSDYVTISKFDGVDTEELSSADYPVVPALSRIEIEGEVKNFNGDLNSDFNGVLEITLYDAEKTAQTLGNGSEGVVSYYNDRKNLLFRGVTKVENGLWKTSVIIPGEIENNFSPAQFNFYAYTPDKKEANGEFSKFYVYGAPIAGEDDTDGPIIESFVLNRNDFQPGQVVHSSPIMMAKVSDPSGINLSNAGIGHSMMLTLDGTNYFTDLQDHYAPSEDDITGGTITYPLADLAPGKHSLKLTVWDNVKNSSSATLDFEVAVAKTPEIYSLSTDVNPARDHVNFKLSTDRSKATLQCRIEVFDLNGRRVWSSDTHTTTDLSAGIVIPWNLCDGSGMRVPRGIYLYRATVIAPEGPQTSKSQKLAVTAP